MSLGCARVNEQQYSFFSPPLICKSLKSLFLIDTFLFCRLIQTGSELQTERSTLDPLQEGCINTNTKLQATTGSQRRDNIKVVRLLQNEAYRVQLISNHLNTIKEKYDTATE